MMSTIELWGDLVKMLTIKLWHTSSFSLERTDFKNAIFEKIHWAPSEILEVAEAIFEVAEAKIWISSIFD